MVTSSSSDSKKKSEPNTKRVDDFNLDLKLDTKSDQVSKKEIDTDTKSDRDSTSSSDLGKCSGAYKSSSHFSKVPRPKDFTKGENFSRFCDRFKEYVYLTRLNDRNLYIYLLQLVDNETYELLKKVRLKRRERGDAAAFCKKYIKAIYPDGDAVSLKSEVLTCKQKSDENIDKFQYRLLEKASIAFSDKKVRDENCLIAFLQGVRNISMKIKLNEAEIQTFDDAVKLAKRLERVNDMLVNPEVEINSILKESSSVNRGVDNKISFDRGRRSQRDSIRYQSRPESSEYKSPRFSSLESLSSNESFKQRYVPGGYNPRDKHESRSYNDNNRQNSRDNYDSRSYNDNNRQNSRDNYDSRSYNDNNRQNSCDNYHSRSCNDNNRQNSRGNYDSRSYSRGKRGRVSYNDNNRQDNNDNYQNNNYSRFRYYNNNYNRGENRNSPGDYRFPSRETRSCFMCGLRGHLSNSTACQGIKRCFGCGSASHLFRTCSQNRNGVYSDANTNRPVLNPTSPSFIPQRYTSQNNNNTVNPNLN